MWEKLLKTKTDIILSLNDAPVLEYHSGEAYEITDKIIQENINKGSLKSGD